MSNPFLNTTQVNAVITIRRGPDVDRYNITPEQGEILYTTDNKRMFIGDGSTIGGNVVANKIWISNTFSNLPLIEKNDFLYTTSDSKFYVLTGNYYQSQADYLLIGGGGLVPPPPPPYVLPVADKTTLGGITIGDALSTNASGKLDIKRDPSRLKIVNDELTVPIATNSDVGVVKVGTGLTVNREGLLTLETGTLPGGSLSLSKTHKIADGGATYTLTYYTNNDPDSYLVFINGVEQVPTIAYTINTPEITFTSNVATGSNIVVYATTKADAVGEVIPIGTVQWHSAQVAPVGYLECNGQIVSKSEYPDLWTTIGDMYSAVAISATHYRVPDLRGEFIRAWDHNKGVDSGRVFGSRQKGSLIAFDSTISTSTVAGITNASTGVTPEANAKFEYGYDQITPSEYNSGQAKYSGVAGTDETITNEPNNFGSTRPRNVALLPCIKAYRTLAGTPESLNFIPKPPNVTPGQILVYNTTNTWVGSTVPYIPRPANSAPGKWLYCDSTSTWTATAMPPNPIMAWVHFDGARNTAGNIAIDNTDRLIMCSSGISRVQRNAAGDYYIHFSSTMPNNVYMITGNGARGNWRSGASYASMYPNVANGGTYEQPTKTKFRVSFAGIDVQHGYITVTGDGNVTTNKTWPTTLLYSNVVSLAHGGGGGDSRTITNVKSWTGGFLPNRIYVYYYGNQSLLYINGSLVMNTGNNSSSSGYTWVTISPANNGTFSINLTDNGNNYGGGAGGIDLHGWD